MIAFNKYYNHFNVVSTFLIVASLILLVFKGLNFGIDFKGGTLIELRSTDTKISVSSLRDKFSQMNLGDVSVKKFGNDTDYLIKFENKETKLVKYVSSGELFLTEGNGLTLTKGLYFILAFVSAIRFPYISKSLALIFEPYLTFGIKLCNAGLETWFRWIKPYWFSAKARALVKVKPCRSIAANSDLIKISWYLLK